MAIGSSRSLRPPVETSRSPGGGRFMHRRSQQCKCHKDIEYLFSAVLVQMKAPELFSGFQKWSRLQMGMFGSQVVQGRRLSAEDVEVIRCLIAEHPYWSRRRLSVAVSEAFNWRTATGQLKDMSARLLLAKLAERGIIKLPPRQRRGGARRLRALSEPEIFW